MKETNFTNRKKGGLGFKANSKLKVSLWFVLFFLFLGMSSQVQAQCTIVTHDLVRISLGNPAEHLITEADVVKNGTGCGTLEITVYDANGNEIDPLIDCSYVGDTLTVCVNEEGFAHGSCTDCCTKVVVCDETPPVIECQNKVISCLDVPTPPMPTATDNCTDPSQITFEVLSETPSLLHCDDDYIGYVVREVRAVDASGNKSAVCTDTLFTERFKIADVVMPDSLTAAKGTALMCDASNWVDVNGNGYPDPGEPGVGVPTYNGVPVFPAPPSMCCVFFDYKDVEIHCPSCDCSTRTIMRTYTAYEWHCGEEKKQQYIQVIEIVDTTGPVVTAPADFSLTTGANSCSVLAIIPPATATEDCSAIGDYYVYYPGGFVSRSEPSAITLELSVGDNEIIFIVYNACGLEGRDTMTVTVLDKTPPIAVCDKNTSVALGADGTGRIFAETFNDNSHDNCGIERIEVRRVDGKCGTGAYDDFGPWVEFCCADLGQTIQVTLRVWDTSGNYNECTANVTVEDNLDPIIVAPTNVTISCTYPLDLDNLQEFGIIEILQHPNDVLNVGTFTVFDVDNENPNVTGSNGYAYDNCSVTIEESHTLQLNECGNGTLTRTFTAKNAIGAVVTSVYQTITIMDFNPFNPYTDIDWPTDITISNLTCSVGDLTPDFLDENGYFGNIIINEGHCQSVGKTYQDDVFTNVSNACFKILRWWKVYDFCECDDCEPWIHCQTITVKYNIAPEFTESCDDITLFSDSEDCDSRYVELVQNATSDCINSEVLHYTYSIDLGNTGTFDIVNKKGNNASGDYGMGEHRIRWTVSDYCGNTTSCEYVFTVSSLKKGVVIAHNNVAINLSPTTDPITGEVTNAYGRLTVNEINNHSYHPCEVPFVLSFSETNPGETEMDFNCDDIGKHEIKLWMHAENGTVAHTRTNILVQANDPSEPCGPGNSGPSSLVSGTITTTYNGRIPEVAVALNGGTNRQVTTNQQGEYSFGRIADNANYTINPELNGDILNGVTTWDLTLIQQHILGINELTDPYLLIAADINNDKRITIVDLVDLRKTILGLNRDFPNNESWRFIDKSYVFQNEGPAVLGENYPEMQEIVNLKNDWSDIDFYGIKIGDLNANASLDGADSRSANLVAAAIQNVEFNRGEMVEVPVKANELKDVIALQYSMSYDASVLEFAGMKSAALELDNENYALIETGLVTMSWNNIKSQKVDENETMFTLVFKAVQAGTIAEALSFNSDVTKALVVENNQEKGFEVEFRGLTNSAYALYQNVPNPVDGRTTIGINLPQDVEGTLTFFDMNGQTLMKIEQTFHKGYNEVVVDKNDLSTSGVVLYNFSSSVFSATKKMIILE